MSVHPLFSHSFSPFPVMFDRAAGYMYIGSAYKYTLQVIPWS